MFLPISLINTKEASAGNLVPPLMKQAKAKITVLVSLLILSGIAIWRGTPTLAQMTDRTQNPNVANFGIAKSLTQEIGTGTGDSMTPDSSAFIIARDPFRAIRRGRQLFQRKFLRSQGQGPIARFRALAAVHSIWKT